MSSSQLRHLENFVSSGRNLYHGAINNVASVFQGVTIGDNARFINSSSDPLIRRECRQALFTSDPKVDRGVLLTSKQPNPNYCRCVLEDPAYKTWLRGSSGSQLLWVFGKTGAGKTMLALYLSQDLERQRIGGSTPVILYYFCRGGSEIPSSAATATASATRNCAISILRGLIHFLLDQRPELEPMLLAAFETQGPGLFVNSRASVEALWQIWEKMVKGLGDTSIYCIIDGLDECEDEHLQYFLRKVRTYFGTQESETSSSGEPESWPSATSVPPPPLSSQLRTSGPSSGNHTEDQAGLFNKRPATESTNTTSLPIHNSQGNSRRVRISPTFERPASMSQYSTFTAPVCPNDGTPAQGRYRATAEDVEIGLDIQCQRHPPSPVDASRDYEQGRSPSTPALYISTPRQRTETAGASGGAEPLCTASKSNLRSRGVFKLILLSREEPECLPQTLQGFPCIQLAPTTSVESPEAGASADPQSGENPTPHVTFYSETPSYGDALRQYVEDKAREALYQGRLSDDARCNFERRLSQRGDGTFQWINLAAEELLQGYDQDDLPTTQEDIYCRILSRIPSRQRDFAGALLMWLSSVYRPLTVLELVTALGVRSRSGSLPAVLQVVEAGIAQCGTLLMKDDRGYVCLAHHSVREFLMGDTPTLHQRPDLRSFLVQTEDAHAEIGLKCLSVLEGSGLVEGPFKMDPYTETSSTTPQRLSNFPLLSYSILYWPYHLQLAGFRARVDIRRPFFASGAACRKTWWIMFWSLLTGYTQKFAPRNFTLLHLAAYFDLISIAEGLTMSYDLQSRLNQKDSHGRTPVAYAAENGCLKMFNFLVRHNATLRIPGTTVMHQACIRGQCDIVERLLCLGFSPNEVEVDLKSWHSFALLVRYFPGEILDLVQNWDPEINFWSKMTKDFGKQTTVLHWSSYYGQDDMVTLLLRRGANLHLTSTTGFTAVHAAAWTGQATTLRIHYEWHGPMTATTIDGWQPLHFAACRGGDAAVQFLLDIGVHPDVITRKKKTPMHLAAYEGHIPAVRWLLNYGASTTARSCRGHTPLHLAVIYQRYYVVQELLVWGADRMAVDNEGRTTFMLAEGDQFMLQILNTSYSVPPPIIESADVENLPIAPLSSYGYNMGTGSESGYTWPNGESTAHTSTAQPTYRLPASAPPLRLEHSGVSTSTFASWPSSGASSTDTPSSSQDHITKIPLNSKSGQSSLDSQDEYYSQSPPPPYTAHSAPAVTYPYPPPPRPQYDTAGSGGQGYNPQAYKGTGGYSLQAPYIPYHNSGSYHAAQAGTGTWTTQPPYFPPPPSGG